MRNPELIVSSFQRLSATKRSLSFIGLHTCNSYLRLFGRLQNLRHLRGWLGNSLLIHTDEYISFVLLIQPNPQGQRIYYRCGFGVLFGLVGNSSTASGSSEPGGTVGSHYNQTVGTYFFQPAVLLYIFTLLFSPFPLFISLSLCL